tara:strand:- start:134 stop:577 length:444 start_codon:yes stop_codon:yes gene_type:complete
MDNVKGDLMTKALECLDICEEKAIEAREKSESHINRSLLMLTLVIAGMVFFYFYPSLYVGTLSEVFVWYTYATLIYLIGSIGRSLGEPMSDEDFDILYREFIEVGGDLETIRHIIGNTSPEEASNSYSDHVAEKLLLTNVDGSMLKK